MVRRPEEGALLTVWRVENPQGIGPYQGWHNPLWEMVEAHGDSDEHMAPLAIVSCGGPIEGVVCGCLTLRGLIEWFDGYLDLLKSLGYAIVAYVVREEDIIERVPDRFGQVAFLR